jgi:hypothetical protein
MVKLAIVSSNGYGELGNSGQLSLVVQLRVHLVQFIASMEANATGQGGQISIDAGLLTLSQGGSITSALSGSRPDFFSGGILPGAQGTAGNIDIRAREVRVSDPTIDGFSQYA